MRILDIEIEGYKSIENQHLSPQDLTVLIGKNNSGKSNIIDLLADFREYFNKEEPGGEWYYSRLFKNGANSINIGFYFRLDSGEWDRLLRFVSKPIRNKAKEEGWFREVRAYRNFQENGLNNDVLVNYSGEWVNATELEDEDEFADFFANEVREIIGRSLDSWEFIDPFRKPEPRATPARVENMSPSGEDLVRALESIRSSPRRDVLDKISDAYVEIMENVTDLRIEYDIDGPKSNHITIFVEERGFNKRFKATEISSGSLEILVLLTRLLSASGDTDLLAIEEPELHLHPGAEKKIFDIITDLAENEGTQVILTTHSEVFVDRSRVDNIVSVTRERETELKRVDGNSNNHRELLGYDNSDLVQSDAVVFVEGRSDRIILERIALLLDEPLSDHGVELIVGNGDELKSNAEPITQVLGQLGIPYCVVLDSDGENPEQKAIEAGRAMSISPKNVFVLDKYCIESYLISSPRAIASSINEDESEIADFIQTREKGGNPANILEELYQEYLHTGYNKEKNGAQIVKHLRKDEIEPELKELVNSIAELAGE